jgi:starch synthase
VSRRDEPTAARRYSVLMIASEAVPFAKTGGLADVAGALPLALARLGHRVTLVIPRYRRTLVREPAERLMITVGRRPVTVALVEDRLGEGVPVVLVDCPELFGRGHLYGAGDDDYPDNARRFAVLVRAAFEFAIRTGQRPDVVHSHDWQGGLAPVYLKTLYASHPALGGVASVFTIHNLAYQGLFPPEWLQELNLGRDLFTIDGLEYWGKVSLLKGGINFADLITTVSPRYSKEIQTPKLGFGFDGILKRRARDLVGILNGIDTAHWNPLEDPHIPEPYGPGDLSGKAAAKRRLLATFGLRGDDQAFSRPLVGMVSRLIDQKGFDLIAEVAEELVRLDAGYVLLGTGDPRYQDLWVDLAARFADRIGVRIGFDEKLAHLIEAGADIFLMPSRFEPCGLNQMYSLRYGTVPVVRATGGLDDTVRNWNRKARTGNGFKFREASGAALLDAVARALNMYKQPEDWRLLQAEGMAQDFSWEASARQYERVYERAIHIASSRLKPPDRLVNH